LEQQVKEYDALVDALDALEKHDASKGDMWHSMIRYLDIKARQKGFPLRGAFELTPLCNLNCKMCYSHMSSQQLNNSGKRLLTGEQWIDLIDQAVDAGLMYALLTGGEALLHPDFDRIYLHMLSKGLLLTVNTNGLLLTEERVAFFRQYPPKMIQISLYGASEEEYEQVTGCRAFKRVLEAIERLKKADLFFEVGLTPSRYMMNNGKDALAFLHSKNVFFSMNSGLFQPREETGRSDENHDLTLDEYVELYKFRAKLHGKEYIPVCQEHIQPVGGDEKGTAKGFRCAGGRSSFAIGWDGTMYPCLMMTDISHNVIETSFLSAWNKIHQGAIEYPFPQECIGCEYSDICTVCIKQHLYGAPAGHANKAICERAQRLAQEGMIVRK